MGPLAGRGGAMTLKAIAEGLLSAFIRSADDVQELNARETAILQALDEVYDRRFLEIKTTKEMKLKTAMAAVTDHDGEEN